MVADIEELEEMDASELHARRLNAKEVSHADERWQLYIPVADGTVDRRLKQPGIVRNEEKNQKFSEENQTKSLLQRLFKMTQQCIMRKLKVTSGP